MNIIEKIQMTRQNQGKVFELNFKKSIPGYALLYRLPDAAQSFAKSKETRFSRKNPFDFILWDDERRILYALEMKTVSGKSISFERNKDENGDIHFHQIKGLNEWDKYKGTICGFIIEFRIIEKTVFIDIKEFNKIIKLISKKSFNFDDLSAHKIKYKTIPQTKKRVNYVYDVDWFLRSANYPPPKDNGFSG